MEPGITFRIVWGDQDCNLVEVALSNGRFAGLTEVYTELSGLKDLAGRLKGFPSNSREVREVSLGEFGRGTGGGAVKLRFTTADAAGHVVIEAELESDFDNAGNAESVRLRIPTEASAIDSFIEQLAATKEHEHRGAAVLHATRS